MQTSAFRVELIRFSLLVTLTVALLSVAIRLASHSESHQSIQPGPRQPATALPSGSTAPTTSAPSSPLTSPSTVPTTSATPAPRTAPGGSTGQQGQPGQPQQPVLPVTGYDAALKLAALSMLLIGAGALTVRSSRRR